MLEFDGQKLLCETESKLHHRATNVLEGLILVGFWSFFLLFLSAVVLELTRGNYGPQFFFVVLWGGAALLLTWIVVPRLLHARTRVYPNGFILPKKQGAFVERYVSYDEVESAVEFSEHRLDITLKGHPHSLTRRDYGDCFDVLRTTILNEASG